MPSRARLERQALADVAVSANRLAKRLGGRERALAYRIKVTALNALISHGWAVPNGTTVERILGIDILGTPMRLHIPTSRLTREALALVRHHLHASQTVAPVRDVARIERAKEG